MIRKNYIMGLTCFIGMFFITFSINAQQPILGPWLWMIAPNEEGVRAFEYTDVDSLANASGGNVTEADIVTNGVNAGDIVGNYAWTQGTLSAISNDINELINNIGMNSNKNIEYHTAYALICIVSETDQSNVPMGANSDDSIKIWLNGQVVHKFPHNRPFLNFGSYPDNFQVNLKKGENLLLVKVTQDVRDWNMLVGIDANVTFKLPTKTGDTSVTLPPIQDQSEYIYWSDLLAGKIQRANLDGSNVQDIITGLEGPRGIAIDNANGKIYWNDSLGVNRSGVSRIIRANLDGSNIEILVTGDQTITEGIALDLSAGKMYWIHAQSADVSKNRIQSANLDGSNIATLVTGLQDPRGLALDASSGKMYWTDVNKLQRSDIDGTNIEDLATVSGFLAYMELDLENQHIYWANHASQGIPQTGKIQRANLDGSNVVDLVDGLQFPGGLALDLKNGKIYWININFSGYPHFIQRSNLDGSHVEELVSGIQGGVGIAISTAPDLMVPLVDTTVSISPTPVESPLIDQRFTVDLNIVGGKNIAGYQATVEYDDTAVRYVSSVNGDFLLSDTYLAAPVIDGNTVTVAAASYAGETSGNGTLAQLTFEVVVEKESTLMLTEVLFSNSAGMLTRPHLEDGQIIEPPYLREDVNRDGAVNILDLVYVAGRFGVTERTTADVNRDGSVDVRDLVLVAGSFGKTPSAASVLSRATGFVPTKTEVESWLKQAQQLNLTDPKSLRGINYLEQLLLTLAPQETALLANYPNPFNPETWIPYQLAAPADVKLQIYAVGGNLVRTLSLGHQDQGIYYDRKRAVYWDGKNAIGESVASGIYYYTLIVGDFTATRKMLILK